MRSERWATEEEITKNLHCFSRDNTCGGAILHYKNGLLYTNNREGNTIILGVPGSGKTRRCTIPMIRTQIIAGESFFVIDPKGEIYNETACFVDKRFDMHVFDFRDVFASERWNPLAYIYQLRKSGIPRNIQLADEMITELAICLYPLVGNDPFWPYSARSLFIGAVKTLMEHAEPDQITIANVFLLITKGDQKFAGSTVLQQYTEMMPSDSISGWDLQSYVTTASETRGGIRSSFFEGIAFFSRSEGLLQMLSSDDLNISKLDGKKSTAIYVILPDENGLYDRLAGVLCSQIMSHFIRIAQTNYAGKLPVRLNVCLEELGNIGAAIPNLTKWMTGARSRNIRIQCVLQSLSQLADVFGPAQATTITSSADTCVSFRVNNWNTLTDLSEKCGQRELDDGNQLSREPLITQVQLASMENGQALIMISGRTRYIEWLPDYTEMFDHSQWTPPKPRKAHKTIPLSFFDMKKLTEKKFKEKIDAMMCQTVNNEDKGSEDCKADKLIPASTRVNQNKENGETSNPFVEVKCQKHEGADLLENVSDKTINNIKPYHVLAANGHCESMEVVEIIASYTNLSVGSIMQMGKNFHFELIFESFKEANVFIELIRRKGGVAKFKRPQGLISHLRNAKINQDEELPY